MTFLWLLLALTGLAMLVSGLFYGHRLARPWDTVAALAVPTGMALALLGALLTAVPGFFS